MVGSEKVQKLGKTDIIPVFDDITFEKQAESGRSVRFLLGGQPYQQEDGVGDGGGGGKDERFFSKSRTPPALARQVLLLYLMICGCKSFHCWSL